MKKRQTNNRQPAKALANKMTDNFSNSEQTETQTIENNVDMHSATANGTDTEPEESSDTELGNL